MHYGGEVFHAHDKTTGQKIQTNKKLSPLDIEKLNYYYPPISTTTGKFAPAGITLDSGLISHEQILFMNQTKFVYLATTVTVSDQLRTGVIVTRTYPNVNPVTTQPVPITMRTKTRSTTPRTTKSWSNPIGWSSWGQWSECRLIDTRKCSGTRIRTRKCSGRCSTGSTRDHGICQAKGIKI